MQQKILVCLFALASTCLFGQSSYKGFIDKYPIELVLYTYLDGVANALYTYQNFDEPIIINGRFENNKLMLSEKNEQGKTTATLTFENYNSKSKELNGKWKNVTTNKQLNITLGKEFDIEDAQLVEWENRELLQSVALKDDYFKLLVSKTKEDEPRVSGIKIFQKKTDSLIQVIETDCELMSGLNNTEIHDYNFDGFKDFSIFESGYAGPNTSRLYFLYNTKTRKFFDSKFEGTSLEFNAKTKTIREHNQCCAGSQQTTAVYKIVNNKMVLIEQHCFTWDEHKQELVERPWKDCQ